jgi:ubiquinone/menaquinone biosynthesis C-methylase UbiE
MHDADVVAEFTQQAETFNDSATARSEEMLDRLIVLGQPAPDERWLEAACGPGIISRRLARHVREVVGVDMTPAMIEVARRDTARAGIGNATFAVGDATGLEFPDASFDGAISRFSIHHIPAAGRVFEELARVVAPGGRVVLADHLADRDPDALTWSQDVERLRDPSHWLCLTAERLRQLGERAGLTLEQEQIVPLKLDFDDWVQRGSGGPASAAVIERQLGDRPEATECFAVSQRDGGGRVLELRLWLSAWRR